MRGICNNRNRKGRACARGQAACRRLVHPDRKSRRPCGCFTLRRSPPLSVSARAVAYGAAARSPASLLLALGGRARARSVRSLGRVRRPRARPLCVRTWAQAPREFSGDCHRTGARCLLDWGDSRRVGGPGWVFPTPCRARRGCGFFWLAACLRANSHAGSELGPCVCARLFWPPMGPMSGGG